jgi:guanylate kinase
MSWCLVGSEMCIRDSGKSTVVKHLLSNFPELSFSISAATRQPRGTEQHGIDYYFISVDEFRDRVEKNEFVEWEMVYEGKYYGTLKQEVERIWANQQHVVFDVDVQGALNIKSQYHEKALAIFIAPPSIEVLEQRLRKRNTDSEEMIQERVKKAALEITFAQQFDVVIVNDQLDITLSTISTTIRNFITAE